MTRRAFQEEIGSFEVDNLAIVHKGVSPKRILRARELETSGATGKKSLIFMIFRAIIELRKGKSE
jgi:hypothetical protein